LVAVPKYSISATTSTNVAPPSTYGSTAALRVQHHIKRIRDKGQHRNDVRRWYHLHWQWRLPCPSRRRFWWRPTRRLQVEGFRGASGCTCVWVFLLHDTFDPDYGCSLYSSFLSSRSRLPKLGKHLLIVKAHLQVLLINFFLSISAASRLLFI
jgi:hypothetical protein